MRLFLYLCSLPLFIGGTYAAGVGNTCTTSADCTEENGLYCYQDTNTPLATTECRKCATIAHAHFTGHGQDNDENSCPWECDAGYYTSSDGTKCEQCPFGATSAVGAESAGKCFFDDTTPIQDSTNKTYSVPSGVKIYLSTGTLL